MSTTPIDPSFIAVSLANSVFRALQFSAQGGQQDNNIGYRTIKMSVAIILYTVFSPLNFTVFSMKMLDY
jgi:hypothetical protein